MSNRARLAVAVAIVISIATLSLVVRSRAGGVSGMEWTEIGPAPLEIDAEQNFQGNGPDSGEVADIAIDPRQESDQVIFAATMAGGIWQSLDGGNTWRTTFDQNASLSMGAVTLDPSNPSIVYAGTGNPTNTGFFKGVGVYKSSDDGQTWTLTPMSSGFGGVAIVRMVMPATNVVLIGTQGGLAVTTDGGNTFTTPTINGKTNSQINDLHLDTATSTTAYASVQGVGIFPSTNSGASFGSNLFTTTNGSPLDPVHSNFTPGFISFAQTTAPDNHTIYASVQNTNPSGAAPNWGLFVSTDTGSTWMEASASGNPSNNCTQCGYDQTIGVDPLEGSVVYLGFVDMWVSTDSGGSFSEIGHGGVHNDHHALTLSPHLANVSPGQTPFWDGSDGGVALGTSQGSTFTAMNGPNPGPGQAIASNLFRNIDIGRGSATNNKVSFGGTQDDGTDTFNGGTDTPTTWHLHIDGDGAGVAVDPCNAANAVNMDDGCLNFTTNTGGSYTAASLSGGTNPGAPAFGFGNTLAYDQICTKGADNGVYASIINFSMMPKPGQGCVGQGSSTFQLFKSSDGGMTYAPEGGTLSAQINAIATVKIDPNVVWLGLADGTLQVSTNATSASPTFNPPASLPNGLSGQAVTAVAIDPTNTQNVVVTYAGFCGATCDNNPNRHVFMTPDGGNTWNDITGTTGGGTNNLPDLPVHAVVIDPNTQPHTIIVGNDAGVLETVDGGDTWQVLGLGMPNVDTIALALDPSASPEVLRAGTFGRSVFELDPPTTGLLSVSGSLNFGTVAEGSSTTQTLQLFNVGTEDLHISSFLRISGSSDFTILSGPATPVTIPAGEEISYIIQLTPTTIGTETATFRINSDDPNQPSLLLTATGTVGSGKIAVTANLAFGTVCKGSAPGRQVQIFNVGTENLHISSIGTGGPNSADFTLSGPATPVTIPAGENINYLIVFAPTGSGMESATFTINSDDPSAPMTTLNATGTVGTGQIAVSGNTNFGQTCAGAAPQTVTIANVGTCNLNVTSATIGSCTDSPNDFSIQNNPFPASVSPDFSLPLTVNFTPPNSSGAKSCTLTIDSNDPTHPTTTLQLMGSIAPVSVSAPQSLTFPPTVVNNEGQCTSKQPFPIVNNGLCPTIIKSLVLGGTNVSDFSLLAAPATPLSLEPGHTYGDGNFDVLFGPNGLSRTRQGTLTVTYEKDPIAHTNATPVVANLCGEGVETGARVLVTKGGVPVPTVTTIELDLLSQNGTPGDAISGATPSDAPPIGEVEAKATKVKKTKKKVLDIAANVPLQTVTETAPCPTFQFHREWGGVSNPVQLEPGTYQVVVTIIVKGIPVKQTQLFNVDTCTFNQNIVVQF